MRQACEPSACGTPSATSKSVSSPVASSARITIREPHTSRSVCPRASAASLAATSTASPAEPEERDVGQVQHQQRDDGDVLVQLRAQHRRGQRVDLPDDVHDPGVVAVADDVEADDLADLAGLVGRVDGASPFMRTGLLDV